MTADESPFDDTIERLYDDFLDVDHAYL